MSYGLTGSRMQTLANICWNTHRLYPLNGSLDKHNAINQVGKHTHTVTQGIYY